jgi:hypothetical protein
LKPGASAPRPDARHFRLFDEAIAILERAGSSARSPELRSALGALDRLREALGAFAASALPPGFADRLTGARLDLNLGDPEGALAALRELRAQLDAHVRRR